MAEAKAAASGGRGLAQDGAQNHASLARLRAKGIEYRYHLLASGESTHEGWVAVRGGVGGCRWEVGSVGERQQQEGSSRPRRAQALSPPSQAVA